MSADQDHPLEGRHNRRRFLSQLGGGVAGVALAGCGGGKNIDSPALASATAQGATAAPSPALAPSPTSAPAPTLTMAPAPPASPPPLPPATPLPVSALSMPSWLANQPRNTFVRIPNSKLGRNDILAFCGMAIRGGEVFLPATGGHGDSSDNGVRSIDITAENPAWQVRKAPSVVREFNVPYYSDGTPSSRHTYYSAHWSELRQRIFLFGNLSPYGPGGTWWPNVDGFDPVTNQWDAAGTWPRGTAIDCIDDKGNGWALYNTSGGSAYGLKKWNPHTLLLEARLDFDEAPAGHPLCHDTLRDQLFSLSWSDGTDYTRDWGVRTFRYRNDGTVREAVTLVGDALIQFKADRGEWCGLEYDSGNDRFLYYDGRDFEGNRAGRIYVIKPNNTTTWDISILPLATGSPLPSPTIMSGVNNRFRYIRELHLLVLLSDGTDDMWAMRL